MRVMRQIRSAGGCKTYLSNGFLPQLDPAEHVVAFGLVFVESIDKNPGSQQQC